MVAYPDVLKRAHTELDSVVGSQRAPTMDDISALPYVQAVINEVSQDRDRRACGFISPVI